MSEKSEVTIGVKSIFNGFLVEVEVASDGEVENLTFYTQTEEDAEAKYHQLLDLLDQAEEEVSE